MKFSTKLRRYIEENKIIKSHFAALISVSPAMVNKYIYQGSQPSYKVAKLISLATGASITMKDMGYD